MKLNRGLGTVVGTVIFLLIAISVIGSLLLISYKSQLFATEVSQAQTLTSLKNAESLQVQCNVNTQNGVIISAKLQVQNTGTVASHILWVIVVPVNNNGQINGPPAYVMNVNQVVQPGQTTNPISLPTNILNNLLQGYAVGVVTAYGNVFWGGNLGGG